LTDRATYMQLARAIALRPLFEGDPALINTYAAIVLPTSPRRDRARRLVAWIGDGAGREGIAAFEVGGMRPFSVWPGDRPSGRPHDLPR
jgi:ABC-type tungstate transport system permease subunit